MIVMRELRRRARYVIGPVVGMALTGYCAYHLVEGNRGFIAWLRLAKELRVDQVHLAALQAQSGELSRKVADLRPDHLDRDLLDKRVRATLNMVGPNEIVVMRPKPAH